MGSAPIVGKVEYRLVVGTWMSGPIRDAGSKLISEELRGHVADYLPRPQSWPEEVRMGEGIQQAYPSWSQEAPAMDLTILYLHCKL